MATTFGVGFGGVLNDADLAREVVVPKSEFLYCDERFDGHEVGIPCGAIEKLSGVVSTLGESVGIAPMRDESKTIRFKDITNGSIQLFRRAFADGGGCEGFGFLRCAGARFG